MFSGHIAFQIMYGLFFVCIFASASSEIINTSSGSVQGVPSLAEDVEAYLGIPYAEPPVGDLRFGRPVSKKKWTDVYNASTFGPPCSQISIEPLYFMPDVTNMSEDCLYLNVWAPKSKPIEGLRPVIIYFHPGAYITGSSTIKAHDGSQLASRGDLIVATLNYRLGMFGYFLSYTEEANGNMGEFDKIMAMKWIKENAKYFNGDPNNISLMGASSGAASISGLMLSPLAKDLFKKAIIISGSQMHPLFGDNNRLFTNSERIASIAGCSNDSVNLKNDPRAVTKCLKNISAEDLVKAQKVLLTTNPLLLFPRIGDELLPKSAVDLFREGKFRKDVDVLLGFAENEGSLFLFTGVPEYVGLYGRDVKTMTKMRAFTLGRSALFLSGQSRPSEIIDYYMKHVKDRTTIGFVRMVANMLGDFIASCNVIFNADVVSLKGNPVYLYKFDFRPVSTPTAEWVGTTHIDDIAYIFGSPYIGNFTSEEIELSHRLMDRWSAFARTGPVSTPTAEWVGTTHLDDIAYIFGSPYVGNFTSEEIELSQRLRLMDRWSAFARTGNPNIAGQVPWLRYSYHTPVYLYIGQEEESIRLRPNERCELWRKRFHADIDVELIRNLRNSEIK